MVSLSEIKDFGQDPVFLLHTEEMLFRAVSREVCLRPVSELMSRPHFIY